MQTGPGIQYFLSDHNASIHTGSPIWNSPFPICRNHTPAQTHPDRQPDLCYGDYFAAVHTFLEKDRFRILTLAASEHLNERIVPADIKSIHIHLEKHGAFYHPARIEVILDAVRLNFVLNVAVSEVGQRSLSREFNLIRHLNRKYKWPYLPKVYGLEEAQRGNGTSTLSMFLGEWFDGFYEFHITSDHVGRNRIVLWDPRKRNSEIPEDMIPSLYERAAEILTCYYDPLTFDQIHPWSHAAGDFIARLNNTDMEMRLISVRNYAPIVNSEEQDARSIIEALLVFLLNLSIQNRLDRSDGVGDVVWAEDHAIYATLKGFFSGLRQIETPDLFSEPLIRFFKPYLMARTESDLMEICQAISNRYPPEAPEAAVINNNLNQHVARFYRSVQQGIGSSFDTCRPAGFNRNGNLMKSLIPYLFY
ncbi:MAG TPA: hypothetical protein HPQ03_16200 [Deltaproteobacteria bacterium]|nr:hypothetical protein [Deltaproteobacteria bacterium]